MRSGRIFGSQMKTDGRRSETIVVCCLGIALVLLVTGVTMQQRRRVERTNDLFRRRAVPNEHRFDRETASGTVHESPYAEF
jgi:hypothetical protein